MSTLSETLASYVSPLVTRHLLNNPVPLNEASAERFPAAVLFADISGFTELTEALAQRGPAGEEQLTRLLNDYFGQWIDLIGAHGGEVVKFAGDALLALWLATDEDLSTATLRTAQCGLAMQEALHEYPAAEDVRLSMRVGVGAGNVFAVHIGGVFNRWEFLVAGEPLGQVSLAEQQAHPGQLILSPEAWALVQDRCDGQSPSHEDSLGPSASHVRLKTS